MSTFSDWNGPGAGGTSVLEIQRQLLEIQNTISQLRTQLGTDEAALTSHKTDYNNPHHVTKTTVDLAHVQDPAVNTIPIGAEAVTAAVTAHNIAGAAHADIRALITAEEAKLATLVTQLNTAFGFTDSTIYKLYDTDIDVGKIRSYNINLKPKSGINPCTSPLNILGYLYPTDSTEFSGGVPKPVANWDLDSCKPAIFMIYSADDTGMLKGFKATILAVPTGLWVIYEKPTTVARVEFATYKFGTGKNSYDNSNVAVGVSLYNANGGKMSGYTLRVTAINGFPAENSSASASDSWAQNSALLIGTDPFGILPDADGVVDVDITVSEDINKTGTLSFLGSTANLHNDLMLAYKGIGSVRFQYGGTAGPIVRVPLGGLKENTIEGSSTIMYSGFFILANRLSDDTATVKQMRKVQFTATPTSASFTASPLIDFDVDKIEFRLGPGKVWTDVDWELTSTKLDVAYDRLVEALDAHGSFFFRVKGPDKTIYFHTDRVYKDEDDTTNYNVRFEAEAVLDQAACALNIWRTQSGTTQIAGGYLTMATSPNQHADSYSSNKFLSGAGDGVAVTDTNAELITLGNDKNDLEIITKDGERAKMNGLSIATLADLAAAGWAGTFDYRVDSEIELPGWLPGSEAPPESKCPRQGDIDIRSYALVGTLASKKFKEWTYHTTAPAGWAESSRVIEAPELSGLFAFVYMLGASYTIVDSRFLDVIQSKVYEFDVPEGGGPGPVSTGDEIGKIPDDADPLNPNIGMTSVVPVSTITPVSGAGTVIEGMIIYDKYGTIGYIATISNGQATIMTITNTDANLPQSYALLNAQKRLQTAMNADSVFTKDDLEATYASGAIVEGMLVSDVAGTLAVVYNINGDDLTAVTIAVSNSSGTTSNDVYKAIGIGTRLPTPLDPPDWYNMSLFERISGSIVKGCILYDSFFTVAVVTDIDLSTTPRVFVQGLTHSTEGSAVFTIANEGKFSATIATPGDRDTINESQLVGKTPGVANVRMGSFIYDVNGTLCMVYGISDDVPLPNRVVSFVCVSTSEAPCIVVLKSTIHLNRIVAPTSLTPINIPADIETTVTSGIGSLPNGTLVFDQYGAVGALWHDGGAESGQVETVAVTNPDQVTVMSLDFIFDGPVGTIYQSIPLSHFELLSGDAFIAGALCYDSHGNLAIMNGLDNATPHENASLTKISTSDTDTDTNATAIAKDGVTLNTTIGTTKIGMLHTDFDKLSGEWTIGMLVWDRLGYQGVVVTNTSTTVDVITTAIGMPANIINQEVGYTTSVLSDTLGGDVGAVIPAASVTYVGTGSMSIIKLGDVICDNYGKIGIVTELGVNIRVISVMSTNERNNSAVSSSILPGAVGSAGSVPSSAVSLYTGKRIAEGTILFDMSGNVGIVSAWNETNTNFIKIVSDSDITDNRHYGLKTAGTQLPRTVGGEFTTVKEDFTNKINGIVGDIVVGSLVSDSDGTVAVITGLSGDLVTGNTIAVDTLKSSYAYIADASAANRLPITVGDITPAPGILATNIIPLNGTTLAAGTEVVDVVGVRGVLIDNAGGTSGWWTIRTIDNNVTPRHSCALSVTALLKGIGNDTTNILKNDLRPFQLGDVNIQIGSLVWDQYGTLAIVYDIADSTFNAKTISTSTGSVGLLHGRELNVYGQTIDINLLTDEFDTKTGFKAVGMMVFDDMNSGRIGVVTMITKDAFGVPTNALVETIHQDRDADTTETSTGYLTVQQLSPIRLGTATVDVANVAIKSGVYEKGMLIWDDTSRCTGVVTGVSGSPISELTVTTMHVETDADTLISVGYISDLSYRFTSVPGALNTTIPAGVITLANPATMTVGTGTVVYDAYNASGIITAVAPDGITIMTTAVDKGTNILFGEPSDKLLSPKEDGTVVNYGQQITAVPIAEFQRAWTGSLVQGGLVYDKNGSIATVVSMSTTTVTLGMVHTRDSKYARTDTPLEHSVGLLTQVSTASIKVQPDNSEDYQIGMLVSDSSGCLGKIVTFTADEVTVVTIYTDIDTDTQTSVAIVHNDGMIGSVINEETTIGIHDVDMVLGHEPVIGTLVYSQNGASGVVFGLLSSGNILRIMCTKNRNHTMLFKTHDVQLDRQIDGVKENIPIADLDVPLPAMDVAGIHSILGALVYDYEGTIGVVESASAMYNTINVRTISTPNEPHSFNFGDDTNRDDIFNTETRATSVAHPSYVTMRNGGTLTVGALIQDRVGTVAMVTSIDEALDQMELETITTNILPKTWDVESDWRQCIRGNNPVGANWIVIASGMNPNYGGAQRPCKAIVDVNFTTELRSDVPTQIGSGNPESERITTIEGRFMCETSCDAYYGPQDDIDHWSVQGLLPGEYAVATHRDVGGGYDDGWTVYARADSISDRFQSTITIRNGSTFMVPYNGVPSTAVHGTLGDLAINTLQAIPVTQALIPGSAEDLWFHFIVDAAGIVTWLDA